MSLGQKRREILLNQLSTWCNNMRNTPLYIGIESLKRRKPKILNLDHKQIWKPARIRPETSCCQQPKGPVDNKLALWQTLAFCKILSIAQSDCYQQHGLSVDVSVCLTVDCSRELLTVLYVFFKKLYAQLFALLFPTVLHLSENFSNLSRTQHSTMSTPLVWLPTYPCPGDHVIRSSFKWYPPSSSD